MNVHYQGTPKLNELSNVSSALIHHLKNNPTKQSWIFAVNGTLGAGKTTLFQNFLNSARMQLDPSFKHEAYVQSPTFTYLKTYEGDLLSLWHVDAYRLPMGLWSEILDVWEEEMSARRYVLWVEWYEKLTYVTPSLVPDIQIDIRFPDTKLPDFRQIKVHAAPQHTELSKSP